MIERLIMAGAGGQGMMLLGKLLAQILMEEGRHVSYFPSYGAEVRGGSAHCHVIYSDEPVHSPIVERADTLVLMNQPSYDRFRGRLVPGGLLLVNSSLIAEDEPNDGATVLRAPVTEAANELGNVKVANIIMLGMYNGVRRFAPSQAVLSALDRVLSGGKAELREVNHRAYRKGEELVAEAPGDRGRAAKPEPADA